MGFIKLDRDIQKWKWYTKDKMLLLWIDILTSASYEDNYYDGRLIKKGQLVFGLHNLSKKLNMSVQSLRTCLNRLKSTGEITIESTNKYSIITVVKWDEYQAVPDHVNNPDNGAPNKPVTNEQQTSNKRVTTTKEVIEVLEGKEYPNLLKGVEDLLPEEKALLEEENWLENVNLFDTLEDVFGRPLSQPETERLASWQKEYTKEYIYNAIREADMYQKKSMDYIDRVLITWKQENRKFEEDS